MAEKHNVAMFVQDESGARVQVGWASPKDNSGVRTFEYSPGFESTSPRDVSFEDDELSQQVAEDQHEARTGNGDAPEFEVTVDPEVPDGFVPLPEVPLTPIGQAAEADPNDADNDLVSTPFIPIPANPADAEPIEETPDEDEAAEPVENYEGDESVELSSGGEITDVTDETDEEAEFQRLLAEEEAANNQEPQTRRELRENEEADNA